MGVVVHIGGRQAIPVRAIPLLTDWAVLSPDVCAEVFAGMEGTTPHLEGLTTYRLDEAGKPQPIAARWWANWIVRELEACSARIAAAQASHEAGYSQWRHESQELLPAGVFVWRDEFEQAFLREYGPSSIRARFAGKDYNEAAHRLNFDPQHGPREDWQTLVMEGFERHRSASAAPALPAQDKRSAKAGQAQAAEQEAHFMDATLDAAGFFALAHVPPVHAAMLLCRLSPHDDTEQDAERISTDETTPEDFKRLRLTFLDKDRASTGNRTLLDWLAIAEQAGRKTHSWARRYVQVRGLEAQAEQPASTPKPKQRSAAQDEAIMAAIRAAGHDPQALPPRQPGRAGIKTHVREQLQGTPLFQGEATFRKAWERLRGRGDIGGDNPSP